MSCHCRLTFIYLNILAVFAHIYKHYAFELFYSILNCKAIEFEPKTKKQALACQICGLSVLNFRLEILYFQVSMHPIVFSPGPGLRFQSPSVWFVLKNRFLCKLFYLEQWNRSLYPPHPSQEMLVSRHTEGSALLSFL